MSQLLVKGGAVRLTRLQRAGKGAMDSHDFLLGYSFPNKKTNLVFKWFHTISS